MANSYKKVYLHLILSVKNQHSFLRKEWRHQLFKYQSGILQKRGHYPLAVNGSYDHEHLLFDYSLKELVPDLVREIKKASTNYISAEKYCSSKFEWQTGYGLFSTSWKDKHQMINYIVNQDQHHSKITFKEEYLKFLKEFEIDYENEYVFNFLEEET